MINNFKHGTRTLGLLAAAGSLVVGGCGGGNSGPTTTRDQSVILYSSAPTPTFSGPVGGDRASLFTMNAEGENVKRLARSQNILGNPIRARFNSNRSQIVFISNLIGFRSYGFDYLNFANRDGSGVREVRFLSPTPTTREIVVFAADFNTDGSEVIFSGAELSPNLPPRGGGPGPSAIYSANLDGSGLTALTSNTYNLTPDVGPDGRIVFTSTRDAVPSADGRFFLPEIYIMNADGSAQQRLTSNVGENTEPAWSPDGRRIVFQSNRDGQNEIYSIAPDGSGLTRLTNNPAEDFDPTVGPDGRIAFVSARDGNAEIYVMNADGSNSKRLTNNPGLDVNPDWR